MKKAKSRFKLSKFENPSGDVVWRVSGTLNGERIRKNFRTRAEATGERHRLDIRVLNETSDGQQIWTTLTHDQNRDAIAAVNMLKRSGSEKQLTFAVDFFLRNFSEPARAKLIESAILEYIDEKSRDEEKDIITSRQFKSIRTEMNRLSRHFSGQSVGVVIAEDIRAYLDTPTGHSTKKPTLKTWNNRRGYLSTFFKFCLANGYVAENPILEIPQYKLKKARGTAETLTAERARELMQFLETYRGNQNKGDTWWGVPGCMVPYYALTLFAGIRPDWSDGEIGKLPVDDIQFDTGVIRIEPSVSKINEARRIKIQPNLRMWLEQYPLDKFPIIPRRRFRHMLRDVRQRFELPHDVMRHTYISMTVGAFLSVGDAALQAGNTEQIIRRHYLDLKSEEEADQFWQIVPSSTKRPRQFSKKDGRYIWQ